jgi:hypothetical protein
MIKILISELLNGIILEAKTNDLEAYLEAKFPKNL